MLKWDGKRPLQRVDYYPAQEKEVYGDKNASWFNRIYWGDNLQVLSHLLKEFRSRIDLIYIDPPFDSKADYVKRVKLRGQTIQGKQQSLIEEKQYSDIWENDDYLQFMYDRLLIMRELLADSGSIYLHCDWHKNSYLRLIMDEVFGGDNFRNEIIWSYSTQGRPEDKFPRKHDSIYFYTKTSTYTFNTDEVKVPYSDDYIKSHFRDKDEQGRVCRIRTEAGKTRVYYPDEGMVPNDVWSDIYYENPMAKVRTDYPTQKPEKLLERIIMASSKPGNLVLDCFMGSGTTQVVAQRLGRRWIGCDINTGAIETTVKRLSQVLEEQARNSPLISNDLGNFTAFKVYNVNEYDTFKNELESKALVMEAYGVEPSPVAGFDGLMAGSFVRVQPLNRVFNKVDAQLLLQRVRESLDLFAVKSQSAAGETIYEQGVIVICSGSELDVADYLKRENTTDVKIEVRDIQQDKKHLTFKAKPEVDLELAVNGEKVTLLIKDYFSPLLMQRLLVENERVSREQSKVFVTDFRQLIDSIAVDIDYDGELFNPEVQDVPTKNEFISAQYTFGRLEKQVIALKITDVLGEVSFITREVV